MSCATRLDPLPAANGNIAAVRSLGSHSFLERPMPVPISETPYENAQSTITVPASSGSDVPGTAADPQVLAHGSFGMRLLLFTFLALSVAILFESIQSLFRQ